MLTTFSGSKPVDERRIVKLDRERWKSFDEEICQVGRKDQAIEHLSLELPFAVDHPGRELDAGAFAGCKYA